MINSLYQSAVHVRLPSKSMQALQVASFILHVFCLHPGLSKGERKVPETTPRAKTSLERVRGGGGAEGIRPPLLAFGWADREKDVGCKQTFNVRASAHGDVSSTTNCLLKQCSHTYATANYPGQT